MIPIHAFLITAAIIFVLGIITILYKKNAVGILMGVELILNAVNLNFIAFARYVDTEINGQIVALFVIILAAAEAAIALAIILNIYRTKTTIDVTQIDGMHN
ncbi:MAG: NADH-quinone oxidoreductase subunit NuoK [Calditrichales bacterium]|nr:MAG: NADH-quinone oxidoreductase subunit NuoK [Calditrichales bacterium]